MTAAFLDIPTEYKTSSGRNTTTAMEDPTMTSTTPGMGDV
jgi:hypothetical protein